MSEPYLDLKSLTKEELIQRHDEETLYTAGSVDHYLAELRHREICELLEKLIHELRRIAGDSFDPSGHSRI